MKKGLGPLGWKEKEIIDMYAGYRKQGMTHREASRVARNNVASRPSNVSIRKKVKKTNTHLPNFLTIRLPR